METTGWDSLITLGGHGCGGEYENEWFLVHKWDLLELAQEAFRTPKKDSHMAIVTMPKYQRCTRYPAISPYCLGELRSVRAQIDAVITGIESAEAKQKHPSMGWSYLKA